MALLPVLLLVLSCRAMCCLERSALSNPTYVLLLRDDNIQLALSHVRDQTRTGVQGCASGCTGVHLGALLCTHRHLEARIPTRSLLYFIPQLRGRHE